MARESVCAMIYCQPTQRLLAVRRKESDHVSLPGGKIETGESKEEALVREVIEETGVEVPWDNFVGKITKIDDNGYLVTASIFVVPDEPSPVCEYEPEMDPHWLTIDAFRDKMAFPIYNDQVLALLHSNI